MKGCGVKANPSRFYFVSKEDAKKVLDACPDAEWRLIFTLARFGGFRVPSELIPLRWIDIDWAGNRITIQSSKTEQHEGKEKRQIPIFPELRHHLEEVWDMAEPGSEFVITRYRNKSVNLRTQLERILGKAGLQAWPKLFQNLRSTRETELSATYPIHVVCAWLGNSPAVAVKHYLQVTDADFESAANGSAKCSAPLAQNAAQTPPDAVRQVLPQRGEKNPEKTGFLSHSV
jgi:integrase